MDRLYSIIKDSIRRVITEKRQPLLEYARVGFMDGVFEVYVHTDDGGNIPHVHVRDRATRGRKFETCVELKTNNYFLHGKYKSVMNNEMARQFAEFMEERPKNTKYQNNYELSVDMWNLNNSNEEVVPDYDEDGMIIVPDYRQLNNKTG